MGDYICKATARDCPVHQAIFDEASRQLEQVGLLNKEGVLAATGLGAVGGSIRWDYIREFLEESQDCELVPLAARYFTEHTAAEARSNPSAFLASGDGKYTAGYMAVAPESDPLVAYKIDRKLGIVNGVGKAFQMYLNAFAATRDECLLTDVDDAAEPEEPAE